MQLLFVTGASSGIGAGIAAAGESDGAVIATVSRSAGPGRFFAADLSSPDSWPEVLEWMATTIDEVGPDWVGFAHCAATLDPIGPVTDVDIEAYARNVVVNSAASQVLGAGLLQLLAHRKLPGTVLQISSGAATSVYPGWSSYSASKAAIEQWTRTVGSESTGDLKVMAIAPGVVATAMQEHIRTTTQAQFPHVEKFVDLHASGRLADPTDVGARLWTLMHADEVVSGAVFDLRDQQ